MLKRIQLPPGINRESTRFAAGDRWYDANNIRFRGGVPEVIGGWRRDGMYTLQGIGRAVFTSRDFDSNNYQFIATDWKYYVVVGDVATDITPVRASGSDLEDPFYMTDGSEYVVVKDVSHGLAVNDWVVFTSVESSADGNITVPVLTQVHGFQVSHLGSNVDASLSSIDYYTLKIFNWATSTVVQADGDRTAIGETVAYSYKVTSGVSSSLSGAGFGAGLWGGATTPSVFVLVNGPVTTDFGGDASKVGIEIDTGTVPSPVFSATDRVYLSGLSGSLGGLDLSLLNDQWWDVDAFSSPNITITLPTGVTATAGTGGGNDGFYYRQISSGGVDGSSRGWGDSASTSLESGLLRRCYIDNFGEDLMFSNSGGPIYYWRIDASTSGGVPTGGEATVAVDINDSTVFTGTSGGPTIVDSFLVSKGDGHVVAFGCNDIGLSTVNPLLVRWSDQNNPFDWIPTTTNTSGGQVMRIGSKIVCGISTKDEVVVFTDAAVYSMRYLRAEPWFGFTLITQGVEIVSPNAAVNASNTIFFMGNDGFYTYSGSVSPLSSSVSKYVFDDFNEGQKEKCFAAVNSGFSEVMWFYPSSGSFEPNRYVVFNYEEGSWSIGAFDMTKFVFSESTTDSYSRTSWRDSIVFDNPMSSYLLSYDPDTTPVTQTTGVMIHELNTSQNSSANAYIESGEVGISDGQSFSLVSRMIADLEFFNVTSGIVDPVVTVSVNGRDFPGESQPSPALSTSDVVFNGSTYTPVGNDTSIRARARSISVRISSSNSGYQWRSGAIRLEIKQDGRR